MRLWSIHPKYLDTKGLLALWREGLLAKKVLEGKTRGYRNHPQLERFKKSEDPVACINAYLYEVLLEAKRRGYNFDESKIDEVKIDGKLTVTDGQIAYEFQHLLKKLKSRDRRKYEEIKNTKEIEPHPIFKVIKGEIEPWEKI
ncbi:pyrimidine dimer DNA glycosylase/endonuclease V [Thermococcus waiotapuensis]|uniref:Pyrimidine dimer DNA glycosylase/endonuclease V n=1 Tax=Thermococcus waiotapuensis TaxID=90909 RepID=A0AAE4NVY7_9EURY|nr:pyrimidine dimer DNA glycosylase/endonuclease V [Thermococcus waiotapuensis]MDV3104232.1 pyrimidine dimer DNA glycosylase/endonuclease V [Thermococcus waiotapuensis]